MTYQLEQDNSVAAFVLAIRQVRRAAGDPSYRRMAPTVGYSAATITRALRGDRLPEWPVVEGILVACRVGLETIRSVWLPRWIAVRDLVSPIVLPVQPGVPTAVPTDADHLQAGRECPSCGSWVTNQAAHDDFHRDYRPRLRVVSSFKGQRKHG